MAVSFQLLGDPTHEPMCTELARALISLDSNEAPPAADVITFAAYDEMGIMGFVDLLIRKARRGRPLATIVDIVVASRFRRKGIGAGLVVACRQHATALGCYKLTVSCAEAIAPFYESCGFAKHELTLRMDLTEADDVDPAPES